jgi:hypothetical protein
MRNVFDQYIQPENRLTHALVSSLAADRRLLREFVQWVAGEAGASRHLEIVEQQLPGEDEVADEEEAERRGLPDAWIHDGDDWALLIESKIESPLNDGQLVRHLRTAERRNFSDVRLLALVTSRPKGRFPANVKVMQWTEVYAWMRAQRDSEWARTLTEYMEVLERRLVTENYLKEGTITVFAGIRFGKDDPYHYGEAKRLLRLALDELRTRKGLQRELDMDPKAEGRPAITGREGTSVWDFLPLAKAHSAGNFAQYPHLTLSIQRERLLATVTVPNRIRRQFRHNLLAGGKEEFLELLGKVHNNLQRVLSEVEGAAPYAEILQRHYPSQRAQPITDARLQFDLRTAFKGPKRWCKSVKRQPQWIEAIYSVLANKHSNVQLGVGAIFPYERCPFVHTPAILNHVASVWLACKPLIRKALG